ncbi:Bifunctional polynucleotide phosphatase/kinase [Holothuria leucospilota]|uniref:Bifunctional polynucleotide phosphatase/kinase n=1 Tax=Holothuria leucospilota TaxID=206669 RepID=A0A9Q1H967_HOLLE|nr:Bifunctional polynucleotide phosphatase/kinase [Holothuria leucospilota]
MNYSLQRALLSVSKTTTGSILRITEIRSLLAGGVRSKSQRKSFRTTLAMARKRAIAQQSTPNPSPSKRPRRATKKKEEAEPKLKFDLEWDFFGEKTSKGLHPLLELTGPAVKGSSKIAGFDLDYTLIRPKSGRKWPTGPKDWMFLSDAVPEKLKKIHDEGFKIIIFTNQRGMEKGYTTPKDFMAKIDDIITALDFPIQTFVATGENQYKKPGTLMWDRMVKKHNDGVTVDLEESYFVGDAAGRAKNWAPGKPKDFSCSDRMFAANIGIGFYTPEEFFDGEDKAIFEWRSVNPREVLERAKTNQLDDEYHLETKDFVIFTGPPASGKSSFYHHFLEPHGYVWVNRDTMKTQAKCIEAAKKAIAEGKSVAIDNTNPSTAARAAFIDLTKKKDYTVRCFVMDTPLEVCHHLNMVRQNQSSGKIRRIPNIGFNVYKKNYQEPTTKEGFSEIKKIPFYPVFENKNDEKLFLHWTD